VNEVLKAAGDKKRLKIIKIFASNNEAFCVSDVANNLAFLNLTHSRI
jgi:hypothetical protein